MCLLLSYKFTSLQAFLDDKRKDLEAKNICYYKPLFRYAPWVGDSNADFLLADTLCKLKEPIDPIKKEMFNKNDSLNVFYVLKKNSTPDNFEKEKENFIKQLDKFDTIILSEEMFFHYDYFYDNYWSTIHDYLTGCTREDVIIDIVTYIRRQDDWVLSKWKEDIRNPIPFPWDFKETLKEYENFSYLNYYNTLLRLEKVFNKEHLIIRNYDRKKLYNNNIIDDFIYVLNVDFDCADSNKYQDNSSQPLTSAYGFTAINKNKVKCSIQRVWIYIASNHYNDYTSDSDKKAYPLNNEERLALLNRYKESNDNISKHFFDGKDFFDKDMYTKHINYKVIKPNFLLDRLWAHKLMFIHRKRMK